MDQLLKGFHLYLGCQFTKKRRGDTELRFDENVWNELVEAAKNAGMNAILLDIHEGIHYGSHPELAVEDAWTRQKMRREIKRLKEMGITIIPKLNFSSCHDVWLGPYEKMLSTPEYYRVCRDVIQELCALFGDSPYFHIGMDEEDERHARSDKNFVAAYRQGKQLWHDLQFLLDCVRDCGKTPIMWSSIPRYHYEEFKANISPEDLIIMWGCYHGVKEEHWTRTDSRDDYYRYYNVPGAFGGMGYAGRNMEYIERDDPSYINFREVMPKLLADGYNLIAVCSNYYKHPYNTEDMMDLALNEWPREQLKGVFTLPWKPTLPEFTEHHLEAISLFKDAWDKFGD